MSRKRPRATASPPASLETADAAELDRPWPLRFVAALGIVIAGALAYANSFTGVLVLDDRLHINPTRLAPGIDNLLQCVSGQRSMVECSLFADYARGGMDLQPYHLTNLVIHLLAGLVLYGVLARGLLFSGAIVHRARATQLAALTALWWTVHPLQTESVTYLIQRAESLMGLFYLVTVYASLRRFEGARGWSVLAVVACLFGMCTKPVMVTAPVLVLLLDARWAGTSVARALRERPLLYLGFVATWLWMLRLLGYGHEIVASAGNAGLTTAGITPLQYFATQGGVILHYLRLAIVPWPLCLDYRWPPATGLGAVIATGLYAMAGLGALVAFVRGSSLGFLATAFFLLLAPSSSVLPIADLAAEHRMYLALAPVLLAVVLGIVAVTKKRKAASASPLLLIGLGLGLALALGTHERNRDYESELRMYARIVEVRPDNARARFSLANELDKQHKPMEAIAQYRRSIALDPTSVATYCNLGIAYFSINSLSLARETFEKAIALQPENEVPHNGLAQVLHRLGDDEGARAQLEKAIALDPRSHIAHENLGLLLLSLGRKEEAIAELTTATRLAPGDADYARTLEAARSAPP